MMRIFIKEQAFDLKQRGCPGDFYEKDRQEDGPLFCKNDSGSYSAVSRKLLLLLQPTKKELIARALKMKTFEGELYNPHQDLTEAFEENDKFLEIIGESIDAFSVKKEQHKHKHCSFSLDITTIFRGREHYFSAQKNSALKSKTYIMTSDLFCQLGRSGITSERFFMLFMSHKQQQPS